VPVRLSVATIVLFEVRYTSARSQVVTSHIDNSMLITNLSNLIFISATPSNLMRVKHQRKGGKLRVAAALFLRVEYTLTSE
jgi:hypothetical protein